ncbi:MAG TPA: hypothetical protein VLN26_08345 [Gaiellaceae bacterium]|nr:hypothetical protein [Gaiellaceae bacterium]
MKRRPRPDRPVPHRPPAPRIDPQGLAAEAELFDEAFAPSLWRRPTPL